MNNLYDILNIRKIDIDISIKKAIDSTKKQLINLDIERTCMIYTSYLYHNLRNNGILAYIIDTMEDLEMDYEHRFIIIPYDENNNYVIDLTINQFGKDKDFAKMEDMGYQLLNIEEYKLYINYVTGRKRKYLHKNT